MIKRVLLIVLLVTSSASIARSSHIMLEAAPLNANDIASIKRGAKTFATHCISCHTLKYLDHNEIAKEAGITLDRMPLGNRKWFANIVPPDLSLVTRSRGPDWVYTYLHSFHNDPSRPLGTNNILMPNTAMLNVFMAQQGQQELVVSKDRLRGHNGGKKLHWYNALKRTQAGTMSQAEYDAYVGDLVNFLEYAAEPTKSDRLAIGPWVLLFLFVFGVVAFLLKQSYWKDVK